MSSAASLEGNTQYTIFFHCTTDVFFYILNILPYMMIIYISCKSKKLEFENSDVIVQNAVHAVYSPTGNLSLWNALSKWIKC